MAVVLATGGYDHKIRFWEATTGVCSKSLKFPESQINCLAISPDKRFIVAGGNPVIHVFDIASSSDAPLLTYDGHTSNVTAIGFQRDGKWLYSCSEDHTIKIWDLRTPTCRRNYNCHSPVNSVSVNASQLELVSGDQSGSIRVWDLQSNQCTTELIPQPDVAIRSVSISPDNTTLCAGNHQGKVFVWRPESSKEYTPLVEYQAHDNYLLKCLVSPDGRTLATTSSDKTVRLWDLTTFALQRTLVGHTRWVWDCTYSADSSYIITASSDDSAKLWNAKQGGMLKHYAGHTLPVSCCALNDSAS